MIDLSDIQEFMERPWQSLESANAKYWASRTPTERLRAGRQLVAQARDANPEWPSKADRERDFEAHVRLSDLLSRVPYGSE